jgi:hypothetical protein
MKAKRTVFSALGGGRLIVKQQLYIAAKYARLTAD